MAETNRGKSSEQKQQYWQVHDEAWRNWGQPLIKITPKIPRAFLLTRNSPHAYTCLIRRMKAVSYLKH